jgi:hypothetical protein
LNPFANTSFYPRPKPVYPKTTFKNVLNSMDADAPAAIEWIVYRENGVE